MVLKSYVSNMFSSILNHKWSWLLILLFAIVYAMISFVNHYNFRTFALDLGVYTNALYDYGHGQFNDKGVFKHDSENLLSDHFDLYLIAFSPLSWLFGEYTLLIVQIAGILFGSFGVYLLIYARSKSKGLSLMAQLSLLLSFAVFASLSFDYHSNVVAVMLVPWVFLMAERQKVWVMIVLIAFVWVGKESMSMFMAFVCLGMAFEYRLNRKVRSAALFMSLASLVYFLIIIKMVMPSMANSGTYNHFKYHALGTSYADMPKFILTHPWEFVNILFSNHLGKQEYDFVKAETFAFLLVSGAWLLVWRLPFLIMTLPLIVMKMCYDDPAIWSIDTHYSVEFAPLLVLGAFYTISKIRQKTWAFVLSFLVVMGSMTATFRYMDNTVYWHDYSRVRVYQKGHYTRNYDVQVVHRQLENIPEDAVVSAQTPFVPHLAYRDKCYTFPIVKDAEFIVVSPSEEAMYPIIREEMDKQIGDTLKSGRWLELYADTNVLVLRRLR